MVIRRKNLTVGRKRSNYSLLFKMECVTVTQICFEQGNVVNDVMLPLLHPSFSSGPFPPASLSLPPTFTFQIHTLSLLLFGEKKT